MNNTFRALSLAVILFALLFSTVTPSTVGAQTTTPIIGLDVHITNDSFQMPDALAVHAQTIRTDIDWAVVETTKGVYNFSAFDPAITTMIQNNIQPLLILDYGNSLYDPCGTRCLPDLTAFANFATATVNHYKSFAGGSVTLWEVWNEPENFGGLTPQQFTSLLQAAYPAIHNAEPNAVVANGGLVVADYNYLSEMYQAGAKPYFDVFNYHEYDFQYDNQGTYFPPDPHDLVTENQQWRQVMAANGDVNKPLWLTEFSAIGEGSGSQSSTYQAAYLAAAYNTLFPPSGGATSLVQKAYWYDNEDDAAGQTLGLFYENSNSEKLDGYAFNLTSTANRFNPSGCGTASGNQIMTQGESFASCNGSYNLTLQTDGNLVFYQGGIPLWATGTYASGDPVGGVADYVIMQSDGNLVVYQDIGSPYWLWASQTSGNPGAYLNIADSGDLAIYNSSGSVICHLTGSTNLCPSSSN